MNRLVSRIDHWGILLLLLTVASCQTPGQACLSIRSDVSMNLYEGEPHATSLRIYPVSDALGFAETSVEDLLAGALPPGMTQPAPIELTVFPGQDDYVFERAFSADTRELGILADYYRRPGDADGTRSVTVRAVCGRRTPRLYMSIRSLRVE